MKSNPCIYCGVLGDRSSEHVFGDWVLKGGYVARSKNKYDFTKIIIPKPGEHHVGPSTFRAGDPLSAQIPDVCRRCNSGWMSKIQERAKLYLPPLFSGRMTFLDREAQYAIANWCVMVGMSAEFFAREANSVATSARERDLFRRTFKPPETWRICIGKLHAPALKPLWTHVGLRVNLNVAEQRANFRLLDRPNMQATAFRVGDLYVLAMSGEGDVGKIVQTWDWRTTPRAKNLLWQLTPSVSHEIPFGLNEMQEGDAEEFVMTFKNYMDECARQTGHIVHPDFAEKRNL